VIKHKPPLVIDLDGTLTPTDTLVESVLRLLKQSPVNLFVLFFWWLKGRVAFKEFVAANSNFSAESLPLNEPLLAYLRKEKATGRRLILATASHKTIADKVSRHLGIFDDVIATDGGLNLKGINKFKAIRQVVGENFVYAGDSSTDIPIWTSAKAAILVNTSNSTTQLVHAATPIEADFPRNSRQLRTWAKALRIHQWVKNLLIFVPLLTAFSFLDPEKLVATLVAFFAFSFVASATYLVNDLWDLDADRTHLRKSFRPIANSVISIRDALLASCIFLVVGLGLALVVSQQFFLMLLLYLFVTSCYSWALKQYVLIDVIALSLLYTLRILAGSVAIKEMTSTWLLAFSVFVFLSLALVKRCSELVSLEKSGEEATSGRDYRTSDLIVLWPLGVGSALCAVVVFGLFISAPDTIARYGSPFMLWFVALGLIYWLSRLWIKTARGEMHDDPVVYALKDKGSRAVFFVIVLTVLGAHFIELNTVLERYF
jgi:4-hydroxybenzoate polyprenyltransferase